MKLILGDSLQKLKDLPTSTVDAVVTDPPYGWGFMGKAWDDKDIRERARRGPTAAQKAGDFQGENRGYANKSAAAGEYIQGLDGNLAFMRWTEEWSREAIRVLKPGGHMLVFCGPRTYHAMAMGVEMAGFEIRDQLQWLFGSGFPKSLDVSKAIDKAAGAEREVIGSRKLTGGGKTMQGGNFATSAATEGIVKQEIYEFTAPATDEAKQWQGYGTALKPANEPIVLARKPLEKGLTVAANVLKWGTGAINVDASRIGFASDKDKAKVLDPMDGAKGYKHHAGAMTGMISRMDAGSPLGRFPANVLFDEEAAAVLDVVNPKETPARYFYVAKASKRERNAGLEGMPERKLEDYANGTKRKLVAQAEGPKNPNLPRANHHPTVKPIKLMEYLVRMITPPGGIVLDPFMGSGTTGCAALKNGFQFIGIDREPEYIEISRRRIEHWAKEFEEVGVENDDQMEMTV